MPPNHKQILGLVKALQRDLIKLYRSEKGYHPLAVLAKDSCSEASRLMAIWIKEKFNDAQLFVLKGEYKPAKYHDVLLVQLDSKFYLIDPSVWQFFKYKRNIFMEAFDSMAETFLGAKRIYGGQWKGVERLTGFRNEIQLTKIIKRNSNY